MNKIKYNGPVLLVVMDGVGLAPDGPGNAVSRAHTEFLDYAVNNYLNIPLEASGEAVGVLPGNMGNSEIGHNALGSGQIIKQGVAKVEDAFATGEIFKSEAWQKITENVLKNSSTLHFSGIFSDGNVHSSISHLEKLVREANRVGVQKIRVHAVFDGRDVLPQSEPKYIDRLEKFFAVFNAKGCDYRIASGAGREVAVADRYESDWNKVRLGWEMIVNGKTEHRFSSARDAISAFRKSNPEQQDQLIPPFVIVDQSQTPIGSVKKGDSFIYFDFRADRAIEISMAFTYYNFPYFSRQNYSPDDIIFAGMTEYNSDTHVPALQLVPPVSISNPLNTYLGAHNISQLAISEAIKFGHITYYFNGNSYEKAPGEVHIKLPTTSYPLDTRPWMASAELTDKLLENLGKYRFLRVNFPGGDMLGHLAEIEPTISAIEAIDLQLARLAEKIDELGGMMLITADHGNAEELLDNSGNPKTSHSLNKVPCIFYDNTPNRSLYTPNNSVESPGLPNVAATLATLLGVDTEIPSSWQPSLIYSRKNSAK